MHRRTTADCLHGDSCVAKPHVLGKLFALQIDTLLVLGGSCIVLFCNLAFRNDERNFL